MTIIKIKKLFPDVELPEYKTQYSAGMDIKAYTKENITIKAGEIKLIKTGLAIALPNGFEAQIRSRSGLSLKNGIIVLNSPGTIDSDYRGEIGIIIMNVSQNDFIVEPNMRIAQMIISKYEQAELKLVEELDETKRANGGFGSTGTK